MDDATTTPESAAAATSTITPALSKDVSFTEKVQQVDNALKSRAAATRELKHKWAAIIKAFAEYDTRVSSRRGDAIQAQNLIGDVAIYLPRNPLLDDDEMVKFANNNVSVFRNILEHPQAARRLETMFAGILEFSNKVIDTNTARYDDRKIDEVATKEARAKLQPVVDEYLAALETYDETVETVANVKEYIAVVKDVAEISAIAQGAVAPKN